MKKSVLWSSAALLCALAAPAFAAETVGQITKVVVYAYQTADGAAGKNPAYVLDPVIRNATVEAVKDGAAELTFLDGSLLTVGSESEVVIDEFVYDPGQNAGSAAMRLTKGLFRYVSGNMPDDKVTIQTEQVTIGIRGTIVNGGELSEGGQVFNCVEGACVVSSKNGNQSAQLGARQFVRVDEEGNLGPVQDGLWWWGEPAIDTGVGFGSDGSGNGNGAPDPSGSNDND